MKVNLTGKIGGSLVIIGSIIGIIFGIVIATLGFDLFNNLDETSGQIFEVMTMVVFAIVLLLIGIFLIAMSALFIAGSVIFIRTGKYKTTLGIISIIVLMVTIVGLLGGILILASQVE